jgi:hypothetical protein
MWPPCDPGFDVGHEHGPITKLYVNLRPKRQRRIKTQLHHFQGLDLAPALGCCPAAKYASIS